MKKILILLTLTVVFISACSSNIEIPELTFFDDSEPEEVIANDEDEGDVTLNEEEVEREGLMKYEVMDAEERMAVCNDGSPAVYYYEQGSESGKWVVWFEGGGSCSDEESCRERWKTQRYLMTSNTTGDFSQKTGILSSSEEKNPDFYEYNRVMLNYCSSDGWVGDGELAVGDKAVLQLRGMSIVTAMFEDLDERFGLDEATEILLTGSSAGGGGVSQHMDRIAENHPEAQVMGIIDSSWSAPGLEPFQVLEERDPDFRENLISSRNSVLDETCSEALGDEYYNCTSQSVLYPYLETPVFHIIDQLDPKKIEAAGLDDPSDIDQQEYFLNELIPFLMESLGDVEAVFSSRDRIHTALTNDRFNELTVDGYTLQEAIGIWYFGLEGPLRLIVE